MSSKHLPLMTVELTFDTDNKQYVATADMGDCELRGTGHLPYIAMADLMGKYDVYQKSRNNGI